MEYRSRDAIFMAILRQINKMEGEARITVLMYKVFLSYAQLKKYMKDLIDHGIIVQIGTGTETKGGYRFELTDKGRKLLNIYEEMHKMVPLIDDPAKTNTHFS